MSLYFTQSATAHGVGVFAGSDMPKGAVVEECVVFPFYAEASVLSDHRLAWTENQDAMASGYACLYNHSDEPNVAFEYDLDKRRIFVLTLRAVQQGEELFKRYACEPWWDRGRIETALARAQSSLSDAHRKTICPLCHKSVRIRVDGTLNRHGYKNNVRENAEHKPSRCIASGKTCEELEHVKVGA